MPNTAYKYKASTKQVRYAMWLLGQAGYSTGWMDATFSRLGAKMKERSGQVGDWLANMDRQRISRLISELKGMTEDV